ncbi:MAG: sugar phosphate nucleotidyltransferase [Acidobacteria bacterium]|nr:sugar phosphate nucleotidyltransferase [Acidobacteriota bacterium]
MTSGQGLRHFHAVILAGGRGTRFWPRSRRRLPKQLLPVVGTTSLLRQTVERLSALVPPERIWVLTSETLRRRVVRELPDVPRRQVIAEPVQRNTGPAIGLAARLLLEQDPAAVMGVFPSDHFIERQGIFREVVRRAVREAADGGRLIVLGIPPRSPETGYGYIRFPKGVTVGGADPLKVEKFEEKPGLMRAKRFVKAGNYYWNAGMFIWRAAAIQEAIETFMPSTAQALARLAPLASRGFTASLRRHYALCDDKSIDYGVLEHAKNIAGFACPPFGWNDVGGWDAVYELLRGKHQLSVSRSELRELESFGNFVDAPGKLTALIGVKDLIVVDTPDALLICSRGEAQRVSQLVKDLEAAKRDALL